MRQRVICEWPYETECFEITNVTPVVAFTSSKRKLKKKTGEMFSPLSLHYLVIPLIAWLKAEGVIRQS